MSRSVIVRAPSNIALIKYMGKLDPSKNVPANPSLSMTLDSLSTVVELSEVAGAVTWSDLPPSDTGSVTGHTVPVLSERAKKKFLDHIERFKSEAATLYCALGLSVRSLDQGFQIRSSNSFPHSSGIASSASSLAALTGALFLFFAEDADAAAEKLESDEETRSRLADLSRRGSGSSCRSFFGPFVAWEKDQVYPVESNLPPMKDLVCVLSSKEKAVPSSEAHARVATSPLWRGRPERARERFQNLKALLQTGEFSAISALADQEAMEMHELFHTASEPFTYLTAETHGLLEFLRKRWGSRVILTLDAGPNVHVLARADDVPEIKSAIESVIPEVRILEDAASRGLTIVKVSR